MRFLHTPIAGVLEVTIEPNKDERGSFGRVFCRREFEKNGLSFEPVQCSLSSNARKGAVRGFHLQVEPHQEAKLVHCVSGRLFDVALDLRPGSPTYARYHALELSGDDNRMIYIPEGCAHAFQTLANDTNVMYYICGYHEPESARGVRWDDRELAIPWPIADAVTVSERDRNLPTFADYRSGF
jgi:dTDP-4-dehydrorhamnose 3,5-epimerase